MRAQLLGMGWDRVTTVHTYNNKELNPDFGLGFFMQKRLDKERIIWYTNSVVNKRGFKIML